MVVDDVVEQRGKHRQRAQRLSAERGGRNNKYTIMIEIQIYDIEDTNQRGSNAVLGDLLGAGIYPVMIRKYRLITEPMIRRGRFHVCSVRDI